MMQTIRWKILAALGTSLGLGISGLAVAQDGHGAAPHGGTVAKSGHHQFDVVFKKDGLLLYPLGPDNRPVDASRLSGTATFYLPSSPKPWFSRELRAAAGTPGKAPSSLALNLDLSKVPAAGVKVTFQVAGLADPASSTAQFTVPFALAGGGEITVTKSTLADQAAINAQKLCKVSGEELGSMGGPLKVSRGGKSILICCGGCVKAIKADPDKYFAARAASPATKGEHDHQAHPH